VGGLQAVLNVRENRLFLHSRAHQKDQDEEAPKKDTGASSLDPHPRAAAAGDLPQDNLGEGSETCVNP